MSTLVLPRTARMSPVATASETPSRATPITAGWTALPGGVVDGGEIVLLAIKPSMWRPLFDSAAWMGASWLVAAVLGALQMPIPGVSMTMTVQLIVLVGLLGLAVAVVRWIPTWYVLSNRRIIDIQGVRTPRISSWALVDIRNTYVHASIEERLTRLGTITFVTDHGGGSRCVWRSVARPEEVHARIRRAIENAIDQYGLGA